MVTTKGAGLNPNAKVWQEIPVQQDDIPGGTEDSPWLQTYSPAEVTEGYTDVTSQDSKEYCDYLESNTDYVPVPPCTMPDVDQPDLGYLIFDPKDSSAADTEVCTPEQVVTEESMRESLKKVLEFCFSRENLSKDLYLVSQMDSDQFVPIWTIACMEDIKALTTDMDLILDVLRASPLVQVDETGEKVRPNHSRCIIILREVPETTPVEEVEALFKSENCPKALSVEFAHNSNWYITFQSDMDALQAYKYLREEVKMFQGKPIMARIKAINTFFGKNGFCSVDSSVYQQHAQPQGQYTSPVYVQQVYNPQQQYPVYPVVSPTWNPPAIPQFETPLAPFPNGGFMNGYSNSWRYKTNSCSTSGHRPLGRNRNHVKSHPRCGDVPSTNLAQETVMDGISSPLSPQDLQTSKSLSGSRTQSVSLSSFDPKDTSPLPFMSSRDLGRPGRDRRSNHRGMRKKREDEHTLKPVMQTKAAPPNFDLEASSFPPLPGSLVTMPGEASTEVRLSDVVRGIKVPTKSENHEDSKLSAKYSESPVTKQCSESVASKPALVRTPTTVQASSTSSPAIKEDKTEQFKSEEKISPPIEPASPEASEPAAAPTVSKQVVSTEKTIISAPESDQGQRKLSYAEVCQRPARDPPPAQSPSPSPPATPDSQPLQELKVNTVEQPRLNSRQTPEEPEDKRPPRQPLRNFRGAPGHYRARGSGLKTREHQRDKWSSLHRGGKRSGKEQNIPPTSPK